MNDLEIELQAIKEITQERFKESLFHTAKHLCGFKDITRYTHGPICNALESPTKRKLIVCPRGSFKSSIGVTAYCIWLIINDPNIRILITSEVYTNSKNFIREIKAIIESKYFIEIFGDIRGDRWGEGEMTVKRSKQYKEATITVAGVGTVKVGQHYSHILLDDVNSNKNSNTPENCQKIIDYYKYLISILDPGGIISITATRYAQLDLIQNCLDNEINIEEENT